MERVDVTILGRDYSPGVLVRGKPTLVAAVRHVDQLMLRIQGTGKVSSNERIAVMAALQIAGELLAMKAPDGPLGGLAVGDFKRRIEDMNATLDDAPRARKSCSDVQYRHLVPVFQFVPRCARDPPYIL